jgi:glycosyltransferase involved in cell wall biosynthesis
MRIGIYTDYAYHRSDGEIYAERAFARFMLRVARSFARTTVIGRLDPSPGRARYVLGPGVRFVPLPHYQTLGRPLQALATLGGAMRAFWRALDDLDCVWLLGPNPTSIAFAMLALARRRRVVLGVRQELVPYVRARHPGRLDLYAAALVLEGAFRFLALGLPTVVVGPTLARRYRCSHRLFQLTVSLVDDDQMLPPEAVESRPYNGELRVLSVGRLEAEKNPLLLADVLARLRGEQPAWRLVVCGEGALAEPLGRRLAEEGLEGAAELRGYVPADDGLMDLYRQSHAFLHVSLTEGLPAVLLEAFAAAVPVVATDVGGIRDAAGDAVLLVPPDNAEAAAEALRNIARDPGLRGRLVRAGHVHASRHKTAAEAARLAAFLRGG